ncbi:hypothetical protein J6590_080405 [Homalodisca vitripennis]|nr:hypothetical protein J6590_080405 [Homalodisca vitripennis]
MYFHSHWRPLERMYGHTRRSGSRVSTPTWFMNSGPVYMKQHNRYYKYYLLVEDVKRLIDGNSDYAYFHLHDGRETAMSTRAHKTCLLQGMAKKTLLRDSYHDKPCHHQKS